MIEGRDNSRIHPSEIAKEVGECATYVCDSSGETRWLYSKTFIKEFHNVISGIDKLVIDPVKVIHGGQFFCYGLLPNMNSYFLARSLLKVYGKVIFKFM